MKFLFNHLLIALLYTQLLPLAILALVPPNPRSDCSQGIGLGYVSCFGQSGCCFGGSVCCASGCCPFSTFCVNVGLANEGCCPLSDSSACGAAVPTPSTSSGNCRFKGTQTCYSSMGDWTCPIDTVCGAYGRCVDFDDSTRCTSSVASSQSSIHTTSPASTPSVASSTAGSISGSASATPKSGNALIVQVAKEWLLLCLIFGYGIGAWI